MLEGARASRRLGAGGRGGSLRLIKPGGRPILGQAGAGTLCAGSAGLVPGLAAARRAGACEGGAAAAVPPHPAAGACHGRSSVHRRDRMASSAPRGCLGRAAAACMWRSGALFCSPITHLLRRHGREVGALGPHAAVLADDGRAGEPAPVGQVHQQRVDILVPAGAHCGRVLTFVEPRTYECEPAHPVAGLEARSEGKGQSGVSDFPCPTSSASVDHVDLNAHFWSGGGGFRPHAARATGHARPQPQPAGVGWHTADGMGWDGQPQHARS
jgi:hypothetical protein